MLEYVTDAEVNSTLLATTIIVGILSKIVNHKTKKPKKLKLPGFHRRGLPRKWNNKESFILVRNYLHTHGYELLDTNFETWKSTSYIKIKHHKCDTWTSKMLNSIQNGGSISCFCNGMSPTDPQYYDSMLNKELCDELRIFGALHRQEKRVLLPTHEIFLCDVKEDKAISKITNLRCERCGTTSSNTMLNNLRQGNGIACFCSVMSPTDSQYYDSMCNKMLCDKLEMFSAFHRQERQVILPTREDFLRAVKEDSTYSKIPNLRCERCGTISSNTPLESLRAGGGIPCFCSLMPLTDPQYYDSMCNKKLCDELGIFEAFHRQERQVILPTHEDFLRAVKKDGCSSKIPNLRCDRCGTTSSNTSLISLRRGGGIPCFCSEKLSTDPQYYDSMCNKKLCDELGVFSSFHNKKKTFDRQERQVILPTREDFLRAVKEDGCSSKIPNLRCDRCGTTSSNTSLINLRIGDGIRCFCSGMSPTDPQYYVSMCNKTLCDELGIFESFHRQERQVIISARGDFLRAVKEDGCSSKIPNLRCGRCGTTSSNTSLESLRDGNGISCFCSGKMLVTDSQYYDSMCNKELCDKLKWFGAFHRQEIRVILPTRKIFDSAVKKDGSKTKIPDLRCERCGTTSSNTRLYSLQQGQGISCKCYTSWMELTIGKIFSTRNGFIVLAMDQTDKKGVTVLCKGRKLRWDIIVLHIPSGKICVGEIDGGQHFRDVYYFDSNWVETNERDTLKLESFYEGKSPPCTNGKPIDFLFRISYKCRSEDECNNLVDQVANNCTKEQSSRFICLSQDEDFYDERGIPKCLDD